MALSDYRVPAFWSVNNRLAEYNWACLPRSGARASPGKQLGEGLREAHYRRVLAAEAGDTPGCDLVARGVGAVPEDPHGCGRLRGVHPEDDAPGAIPNDYLAESSELAAKGKAGFLANVFEADELCQERWQRAILLPVAKISDRVLGQLDPDRHGAFLVLT